MDFKLAITEI